MSQPETAVIVMFPDKAKMACVSPLDKTHWWWTHAFYISNTFICNTRLKLTKNQACAKQHLENEFLLPENYSLFLSTRLSQKSVQKQTSLFY